MKPPIFIHGSWEEELPKIPDGSIDLVLTDPPYGMSYRSGIAGHSKWNKKGVTHSSFESPIIGDTPLENLLCPWDKLWQELYRVLADDTYIFVHCNIKLLSEQYLPIEFAGFTHKGALSWQKGSVNGGAFESSGARDWEPILYAAKGTPKTNPMEVVRKGRRLVSRDVISESKDWTFHLKDAEKCKHPTQKPIKLARQIIAWTCPEKGRVLDPFGGTATTAWAAQIEGRTGISIEVALDFHNIAKNRKFEGRPPIYTDRNPFNFEKT